VLPIVENKTNSQDDLRERNFFNFERQLFKNMRSQSESNYSKILVNSLKKQPLI
jgi:hypothetical protein